MGEKMTSLNFSFFLFFSALPWAWDVSQHDAQTREPFFFFSLHWEFPLILRFDRSILSCGIFGWSCTAAVARRRVVSISELFSMKMRLNCLRHRRGRIGAVAGELWLSLVARIPRKKEGLVVRRCGACIKGWRLERCQPHHDAIYGALFPAQVPGTLRYLLYLFGSRTEMVPVAVGTIVSKSGDEICDA